MSKFISDPEMHHCSIDYNISNNVKHNVKNNIMHNNSGIIMHSVINHIKVPYYTTVARKLYSTLCYKNILSNRNIISSNNIRTYVSKDIDTLNESNTDCNNKSAICDLGLDVQQGNSTDEYNKTSFMLDDNTTNTMVQYDNFKYWEEKMETNHSDQFWENFTEQQDTLKLFSKKARDVDMKIDSLTYDNEFTDRNNKMKTFNAEHTKKYKEENLNKDFNKETNCNDKLTHVNESGEMSMVDVSSKGITRRTATARVSVILPRQVFILASQNKLKKGDLFSCARLAGIMGAKRTSDLIPLCHPLPITHLDVKVRLVEERSQIQHKTKFNVKNNEIDTTNSTLNQTIIHQSTNTIIDPEANTNERHHESKHVDDKYNNEDSKYSVEIITSASTVGNTGVEMEALTAASVAALTVYDMCKAVSHNITITDLQLLSKYGGKRDFNRSDM